MNFKAITEKLSEVSNLVKSKFAEETEETPQTETTETTEVEAQFMEVTLLDGETVISYEGELAEGVAIFMIVDGESVPATEGTLELGGDMEGVSIVVDADGMVSEVIDAREETTEEVEEVAEAMSSEEVNAIFDEKMSGISEPLNAIATGIESILKENSELKSKLTELETNFNEFKELPSIENEEQNKFSRDEKPTSRRENYLINLRKK
jgi:hypothetical protein